MAQLVLGAEWRVLLRSLSQPYPLALGVELGPTLTISDVGALRARGWVEEAAALGWRLLGSFGLRL